MVFFPSKVTEQSPLWKILSSSVIRRRHSILNLTTIVKHYFLPHFLYSICEDYTSIYKLSNWKGKNKKQEWLNIKQLYAKPYRNAVILTLWYDDRKLTSFQSGLFLGAADFKTVINFTDMLFN